MTSPLRSVASTATASAIHALATDGDAPKYQDQARGQRDLYTQIVISITLGFSAFMTFCVRLLVSPHPREEDEEDEGINSCCGIDIATEMESVICCSSEATDGCF